MATDSTNVPAYVYRLYAPQRYFALNLNYQHIDKGRMMPHEVYWMKEKKLLFANYIGEQTVETITACLDDMAAEFDKVDHPVFVLINWLEVTQMEAKALLEVSGHRAYSHPMAARGVLVGFDPLSAFQNQVTATQTRGDANTIYFKTMDEALDYLKEFLKDD